MISSVVFSQDGSRIISGSADKSIRIQDAAWKREMLPVHATYDAVTRLGVSCDDRWIATGDSNGVVQVWSAESGLLERKLSGHTYPITALGMHPTKPILVSGSSDSTIRFWMLSDNAGKLAEEPKQPEPFRLGEGESAWAITFSSDGNLVAVGSTEGIVRVFDARTKVEKPAITAHSSIVKGLKFTAGDSQLITAGLLKGGKQSEIRVWNVASGELVRHLATIDGAWTAGIAVHGNRVASGNNTGEVSVWDFETSEQLVPNFRAHDKEIHGIAFSPDGTLLATGDEDGLVRIWNCAALADGKMELRLAKTLTEHKGIVNSVAFSHGGTRLVSCSNDGTARVWLLRELLPLRSWENIEHCADEQRVVPGSEKASVPGSENSVIAQSPQPPEKPSVRSNPTSSRHTPRVFRMSWLQKIVLLCFVAFVTVIAVAGRHGRAREEG